MSKNPAHIFPLLVVGLVLSVHATWGQDRVDVNGTVWDVATRRAIPSASVYTASRTASGVTDSLGRFHFTVPSGARDTLIVQHLGFARFARVFQPAKGSECVFTVKLKPKDIPLPGVTVTESLPARNNLTVRTLNAEQLMVPKEDDLERALVYLGVLPGGWMRRTEAPEELITLYVDGVYLPSWSLRGVDPKMVRRVRLWKAADAPAGMPAIPTDCMYVLLLESK